MLTNACPGATAFSVVPEIRTTLARLLLSPVTGVLPVITALLPGTMLTAGRCPAPRTTPAQLSKFMGAELPTLTVIRLAPQLYPIPRPAALEQPVTATADAMQVVTINAP